MQKFSPMPRACLALALAASLLPGCRGDGDDALPATQSSAQSDTAPPAPLPGSLTDPDAPPPVGRAAPPMPQPVVLGDFIAADDHAKDATGRLSIEEDRIRAANGTVFMTERIAVVQAGDEYAKGERYADVLMVGAEQPVELRRVVEQIPGGSGTGFCSAGPASYLALARVIGGDGGREALRVVALQGDEVPAASSQGTSLCSSAQYLARL